MANPRQCFWSSTVGTGDRSATSSYEVLSRGWTNSAKPACVPWPSVWTRRNNPQIGASKEDLPSPSFRIRTRKPSGGIIFCTRGAGPKGATSPARPNSWSMPPAPSAGRTSRRTSVCVRGQTKCWRQQRKSGNSPQSDAQFRVLALEQFLKFFDVQFFRRQRQPTPEQAFTGSQTLSFLPGLSRGSAAF
jgi:hypothetical protein